MKKKLLFLITLLAVILIYFRMIATPFYVGRIKMRQSEAAIQ